jgi:hypothetical protein
VAAIFIDALCDLGSAALALPYAVLARSRGHSEAGAPRLNSSLRHLHHKGHSFPTNSDGCRSWRQAKSFRPIRLSGTSPNSGAERRNFDRRHWSSTFCHPKACGEPPPLRSTSRAGWRIQILGGDAGPIARSRGQAARGRSRRSPVGVRRLRRYHPEGSIRRRHGPALGPRLLGTGGGPDARRGLRQR